jgi:acetyltransferase
LKSAGNSFAECIQLLEVILTNAQSKGLLFVLDTPKLQSGLFYGRESMDIIFNPKSVAIIGATEKEGSVGRTLVYNLISSPFGGTVYPVNPKRDSILGIKAYSSLSAIGDPVDLAVIVTPARTVPNIIRECVDYGVKGAIVISAGFKEVGEEGAALEAEILQEARKGNIRIIGPNCLGVMRPTNGLNATFASTIANPGNVGFISQSGALCTAVLDWSFKEKVGFSAFVSIGSMLDVSWGDLIYYLGDDPNTESIVIYMETIGDASSFLSAAREVALTKPIIVIKAGRTAAAAQAAASHTGSLAGSDEVLEAAFRRVGVLRINRISDVFYTAEVLAKQPRPKGRRLTILTNAGGPGVLATDALITEGGELAVLSDQTMDELNDFLPGPWSHGNPVDILGDADPVRYAKSLEIAGRDENSDGLLVILTPQAMTDPTDTAKELIPYANMGDKPVLASWMGGEEIAEGEEILNQIGIPTFPYPDTATRLFNYMWQYAYNLRALYETPARRGNYEDSPPDRATVTDIIETARAKGQTVLNEFDSKRILAAYGIPIVETRPATTEDDAVAAADAIGYPTVLKLYSETVTHKTDVGGVRLNLNDEDEVRRAYQAIQRSVTEKVGAEHFQGVTVQPMVKLDGYEIIIGSSQDEQFGPVLLFGTGGTLVEVFKDRALALPPLNATLARRMMEQTKIYEALKGVRGREAVNLVKLEELMVRFSQLISEHPSIKELDINPLLVSHKQIIALDARVLVYPSEVADEDLPQLAIRPYPIEHIKPYTTKDGHDLLIRPIRPEDEPALVDFHETLSGRTVYLRYAHEMTLPERVAHERLSRISFIDYNREMTLVAENKDNDPETVDTIVGAGRLIKVFGTSSAEFNLIISDEYQGKGLGTELLSRLMDIARIEGLTDIFGRILPENAEMQGITERLGFEHETRETDIIARINL